MIRRYRYLPLGCFLRPAPAAGARRRRTSPAATARSKGGAHVAQIRQKSPKVQFSSAPTRLPNDPLMRWCETNRVDYVFGLAHLPAGGGPRRRARRGQVLCLTSGKSGECPRLQISHDRRWSRARRVSARPSIRRTVPIRASLSPPRRPDRLRCAHSLRDSTVPAARPSTASASNSSCLPIARSCRRWLQWAAPVVLGDGVRSRRAPAPCRPAPSQVADAAGRPFASAPEARRTGAHQRAPHRLRHRLRAPRQGRVRARLSLSAACLRLHLNGTQAQNPRHHFSERWSTRVRTDSRRGSDTTTPRRLTRTANESVPSPRRREPSQLSGKVADGPDQDRRLAAFEKSRLGWCWSTNVVEPKAGVRPDLPEQQCADKHQVEGACPG